jgi:hypothetical protein
VFGLLLKRQRAARRLELNDADLTSPEEPSIWAAAAADVAHLAHEPAACRGVPDNGLLDDSLAHQIATA